MSAAVRPRTATASRDREYLEVGVDTVSNDGIATNSESDGNVV